MSKRIKVVWLCHFANRELLEFYKIKNGVEFASWVSETLKAFINDKDVEIHIVAPNVLLNKDHEFRLDGINYYLFKYRSRFISRKIFNYLALDYRSNFYAIKKKVKRIVNKLNPDLIHLHGAENPYYSSAILQFFDIYPILVTIQGFIKDAKNKDTYRIKQRIKIEAQIINTAKFFGVQAPFISHIVLGINQNSICFEHQYLRTKPKLKPTRRNSKKFDCVFFARVCIDKGIEDLLDCISIIKKLKPDITLIVIGYVTKKYLNHLIEKCENLEIRQNVTFIGYLTPKKLYDKASLARVSVLPTYYDIIPGTVIESMYMKIPVVAYGVGGLLDLNLNGNLITIVEKGDINYLADSILYYLDGNNDVQGMIERAYKKSLEFYDYEVIKKNIKRVYRELMDNIN